MILAIRTNVDPAEVGLLNDDGKRIDNRRWQAGYQLSQTLLAKIVDLLKKHNYQMTDITGIVVHQGPGGFTGLRLGILTANTLAYSLDVPVAGVSGKNWLTEGIVKLKGAKLGAYVHPEYGRSPHITKPKK